MLLAMPACPAVYARAKNTSVPATKLLNEKGLATGDQKHTVVDSSASLVNYSASPRRGRELFIQAAVGASAAHRVSVKMMVLGHRGVERVGSNGFWPL